MKTLQTLAITFIAFSGLATAEEVSAPGAASGTMTGYRSASLPDTPDILPLLAADGSLALLRDAVEERHADLSQTVGGDNLLEVLVGTEASDLVPKARYLIGMGVPVTPKAVDRLLKGIAAWHKGDSGELRERRLDLLALFVFHGAKPEAHAQGFAEDDDVQYILAGHWGMQTAPDSVFVPEDTDNAALAGLFRQEGYTPSVLRAVREFGLENTKPLGEEREGKMPVKLRILPGKGFITLQLIHHTRAWETYVAAPDGRPLLLYRHSRLAPLRRVYQDGDDMVLEWDGCTDRFPILGKNLQPGVRRYQHYIPYRGGAEYGQVLPEGYDLYRFEFLLRDSIQTTDKVGELLSGIHDKDSADAAAPLVKGLVQDLQAGADAMEAFTHQELPDEVWAYVATLLGLYNEDGNAATTKLLEAAGKLTNADFFGSDALKAACRATVKH